MCRLYIILITPCLIVALPLSTEMFPLNNLIVDLDSFNSSSTYNSTFNDDLIYLETPESSAYEYNENKERNNISSDVKDFIGLIPVEEVRMVIGNYYENVEEIRMGIKYLKDSHFLQRLLNVTEISSLVCYLHEAGLDVEAALEQIFDLIGDVESIQIKTNITTVGPLLVNKVQVSGGMHVMVDSVLEVIPQDEILNMFFDKMDSSSGFIQFFNDIREPRFGYLVQKLEESSEMKYLVYDLHNHGINMEKIVDSLKNYFFLGTFN